MAHFSPPINRRHLLNVGFYATLGTTLGSSLYWKNKAEKEGQTGLTSTPQLSSPPTGPDELLPALQPGPAEEASLSSPPPDYASYLSQIQLRHIRPEEVITPHFQSVGEITNTLPPPDLWAAMPATLLVADEIRERLGRPLQRITSAYRNPVYNRACGGASQSWHTRNCALDLIFEGGPQAAGAIAKSLREEGFFHGGIGFYRTFIHIDTRGENATWWG